MSDINLDFTVSNNNIDLVVQATDIRIVPEDIQLSIYAAGLALPQGNVGELQYNAGGVLGGVPTTSYSSNVLSLGSTNNISISGGSANYVLTTNGAGVLTWAGVVATSLNADINNVHISGGTNGYVLQTDGTGNLSWTAQTGGGGNGSPGGSNTQIQYNDNGLFGGNVGFTFNEITGNVNIPTNLIANGLVGNIVTATQPNITTIGSLLELNVVGTTTIQQVKEKVTSNATGSSSTVNFDLLTQAILYKTAAATNNFTINFRGNSSVTLDSIMSSNQSMTCTYINTNTFPAYYANAFTIDGNTVTVNWAGGTAPTAGNANAKDLYNFNILKTGANTFVVFGTAGGYY